MAFRHLNLVAGVPNKVDWGALKNQNASKHVADQPLMISVSSSDVFFITASPRSHCNRDTSPEFSGSVYRLPLT